MGQKSLSIDLIITDAGTQMRAGTRLETVKEYAAMFVDKKWPFDDPLVVFNKGESYWLADGFHRHEAAVMAKRGSVTCDVRKGTLEDAQNFALSANARHGLRRSNEDKRHAVRSALGMEQWADKSNRMIADACGVGESLVRTIKSESTALKTQLSKTNNKKPTKTTGKDGKKRSAKPKTHQREPGDESEPTGEEPVNDWKIDRSKAVKTSAALQRAIDDLNEAKPNDMAQVLIDQVQDVEKKIKGWK